MNLRLRMGPEGFAAECQNEPVLQQTADAALTVEQVLEKVNGHKRGEVPPTATRLTMFVELHDKLLFYAVCAWQEDFTGFVVEYGTFPDQRRSVFTLADASRTLGRAFQGMGTDGAIHAGLEKLISGAAKPRSRVKGCAVAASMLGVRLPGQDAKPIRQRKRYTQADMRRP